MDDRIWATLYAAGVGSPGDRGNKIQVERGWPGTSEGPAGPCVNLTTGEVCMQVKPRKTEVQRQAEWLQTREQRQRQEREEFDRKWETDQLAAAKVERDRTTFEQQKRERRTREQQDKREQMCRAYEAFKQAQRECLRRNRPRRAAIIREYITAQKGPEPCHKPS